MPTIQLKHLSLLEAEAVLHLANVRLRKYKEEKKAGPADVAHYDGTADPVALALATLTKEKLVEMVALMWLGRGAGEEKPSDWPLLLENAAGHFPGYVAEKYPLGEYLDAGLRKLGYTEAERLLFE